MRALLARSRRQSGFSLIELAAVMVILAAVGGLLWFLLPRLTQVASPEARPVSELREAEQAIIGFAIARSRLPCPDTDNDGVEDCAASANAGLLPQRTLGQVFPAPIRYAVTRGALNDLTALSNRYVPPIPLGPTLPAPAPPPTAVPVQLNGLDLCVRLRDAQGAALGNLSLAGGIPAAFALAHPGALDMDGDGSPFDGASLTQSFALPGTAPSNSYDDYSRAVGIGQLASRLGCLKLLSLANGAARSAGAARDLYDYVVLYRDFRIFNRDQAESALDQAEFEVAMAAAGLALAIASEAISIAGAAESLGAAAFAIAIAAANIGVATAQVVIAAQSLSDAQDGIVTAQAQLDAANLSVTAYLNQFNAADARARAIDARGLVQ